MPSDPDAPGHRAGPYDTPYRFQPEQDSVRSASPIAVLVLDGVLSTGLALGARAAGFGWGPAFLFGWAGGAVATLAVLAGGMAMTEALQRRKRRRATAAADDLGHARTVRAWDADARADSAASAKDSRRRA